MKTLYKYFIFVLFSLCNVVSADTGDVFQLPGSGALSCGASLGPTIQVDFDGNGVPDTLVAVFTLTGHVHMIALFNNTFLEMTPDVSCTADANARVKIRFVDMLASGFNAADDTTWVYKSIPALRIDGTNDSNPVDLPAVMNIYAYQEINQTDRVAPIYGTLTGAGTKVFSHPLGIKEIYIRTGFKENNIDDLILMATAPNTPIGTNVTANLSNGSVDYAEIEVPGNTFIQVQDTGHPAPTDIAACAPSRPVPPYFVVETNALNSSFDVPAGSEVCVEYPPACTEPSLSMLTYTVVGMQCGPQPCGCNCAIDVYGWDDVTTSINTANNIICGDPGSGAFIVAEPVADVDGDGVFNTTDCNDNDSSIFPGASEICDDKDNNCDGQIDEGLPTTDTDGDGHYLPGSCSTPADDCDDTNAGIFPGATEICDGVDNNCDTQVDEGLFTDADGDGFYSLDSCLQPANDCDDSNPAVGNCNTPPSTVPVTFTDKTGDVSVTLPNVTVPGDTTVTSGLCTGRVTGITLTPTAPICVTVDTTAEFTGEAEVCITYDDTGLNARQESFLSMVACDNTGANCELLPPSRPVDTANNIVCAYTTHFSLFAVGFPVDSDRDGSPDLLDNCPNTVNFFQEDTDVGSDGKPNPDGIGNVCDNCSVVPNPNQRDTDADGFGNICDPDYDNNLVVNAGDLAYLKSKFFTSDPNADLDGRRGVNAGDLAILKSFFFKAPGPSGLVP